MQLVWAAILFAYGAVGLGAMVWPVRSSRGQVTCLQVERIARTVLCLAAFIYAFLVIRYRGFDTSVYSVLVIAAFGFSSIFRVIHISLWFYQLKRFNDA